MLATYQCLKCQQEFVSRSDAPDKCHNCRSAAWDKPAKTRYNVREQYGGCPCGGHLGSNNICTSCHKKAIRINEAPGRAYVISKGIVNDHSR